MIRKPVWTGIVFLVASICIVVFTGLLRSGIAYSTDPPTRQEVIQTSGPIPYRLPPDFSERLVFQSEVDGDFELFLLSREGLRKLTDNDYAEDYPVFSPDGSSVLYSARP